jgi:hypothetical protein
MEEVKAEKPVKVTLPEDPVVEVELTEKEPKVSEASAKITEVDDEPKAHQIDEREKALKELKSQYEYQKRIAEAERDARRQAEQYAHQQAQQIGYAHNEVQDSNLKIILNAIDATEQAAANAERDYAFAAANGDHINAAKAQRLMAQAEAHLLQLQNGKQRLEETLQQTSEGSMYAPQVPSFEPMLPPDPVEQYAVNLAPKSAEWLRSHPDAVSKIGRLTRAHQDAVEDGIQPESKEYFRYIESRLGYGDDAPMESEPAAQKVEHIQPNRRAMASAPVTSSASITSSRSGGNGNTMTLNPQEVEVALLMEPELPRERAIEAYARNKAQLIKQGKLAS